MSSAISAAGVIERAAAVEVRMSGRTLRGVALRYGERSLERAEMFEAGAFAPLGEVSLNLQHDRLREIASTSAGNLRITDTADALRIEADLREGSAELSLIRRRALRGLSVEFVAASERRRSDGLRVIESARLPAIGLVDMASYRSEIELRAAFDEAWLTGEIRYGPPMQCTCQGGGCDQVIFEPGAFDDLAADRPGLLAIGGEGFASVLGSLRRGTLALDDAAEGLRIGLVGTRETPAARRVVEAATVGEVFARPMVDLDASEFVDEGPIRRFTRAAVTGILIKSTPNDQGHIPVVISGLQIIEERARRFWL